MIDILLIDNKKFRVPFRATKLQEVIDSLIVTARLIDAKIKYTYSTMGIFIEVNDTSFIDFYHGRDKTDIYRIVVDIRIKDSLLSLQYVGIEKDSIIKNIQKIIEKL